MLTVKQFYAEGVWGLGFGEYGSDYTIVPGRHIGFDVERTGDIPALLAGVVVRVVKTGTMAWGVVTDIGNGLYLSYWHLANDNLPSVGAILAQGDRIARIARGPRTLPYSDPDFPGTAWYGQHTHIVVATNPDSAYAFVAGNRTLDAFRDPLAIIRLVLTGAAGDDARPFNPETKSEEDDMAAPIRIISAPAWEAAGKRLITNGSSVLEVAAGAAQVLIQNGVPYRIYEGDNANTDMLYEVAVTWALGGIDAGTVAERVKSMTQTVNVDAQQIAEDIASRLKTITQ